MPSAKHLGPLSLGVCVAGMVAMEALIHTGVLANPWWRVLAMAFEAGTVGGMADWFAVSAMFRPVPIPLLSRHTDIIARNRPRIVENLKDYVQNKLLTPEVIREQLAGVRFWTLGLRYLDSADSRQRLAQVLRSMLGNFAAQLDREEVIALLATAARERFVAFDLAKPLGGWMRHALERGDHTGLWQEIIDEAGRYVGSEPVRMRIAAIIKEAAAKEKAGGLAKRLWLSTGEWAGGLNYESWADEVVKAVAGWLGKVKADPDHRFRKAADGYLLDYATALEAGRADAVESIERFARGVMEKADLQPLVATAIADLQALVSRQLGDETSKLSLAIAALIDGFIDRLRSDPGMQAFVDHQVRESICLLITENHGLIGDMVGASLSPEKLSDRELVAQIEERVGSDLQYIRLNGAIVGGMIGAIIMIVKLVFLGG